MAQKCKIYFKRLYIDFNQLYPVKYSPKKQLRSLAWLHSIPSPPKAPFLPAYLNPNVHPGLSIPTDTAKIAKEAYSKLNYSHLQGEAKTAYLQEFSNQLRKKHFTIIDADPTLAKLNDSELHENAVKILNQGSANEFKFEERKNDSIKSLLCGLNQLLVGKKTDGYRTSPLFIFHVPNIDGIFQDKEAFRAYLKANDPPNLPVFEKIEEDEFKLFLEESLTTPSEDPIEESNILSSQSKALYKKYFQICTASQFLPKKMNAFFDDLKAMMQSQEHTPYEIAAFAHMRIVGIHPFNDGNGRTARLFMNIILARYALPPIYFYSEKGYTEVVKSSIKDPTLFTEFVARKVYYFEQLSKVAKKTVDPDQYMATSGLATCTFALIKPDEEKSD